MKFTYQSFFYLNTIEQLFLFIDLKDQLEVWPPCTVCLYLENLYNTKMDQE